MLAKNTLSTCSKFSTCTTSVCKIGTARNTSAWIGTTSKKKFHVSMLEYVPEALMRFQHKAPSMPQHQLYLHVKPTCSATCQYAEASNTLELLSKESKTYIQEVIITFSYYARCVDSSMLPALRTLATQQATPTKNTMKKIKQFLDYALTNPNVVVTYHASNMVLAGHSNASYLSESMYKAEPRSFLHVKQCGVTA